MRPAQFTIGLQAYKKGISKVYKDYKGFKMRNVFTGIPSTKCQEHFLWGLLEPLLLRTKF